MTKNHKIYYHFIKLHIPQKKRIQKKFLWSFNSIATKTLNTYACFGIIPIETKQQISAGKIYNNGS